MIKLIHATAWMSQSVRPGRPGPGSDSALTSTLAGSREVVVVPGDSLAMRSKSWIRSDRNTRCSRT